MTKKIIFFSFIILLLSFVYLSTQNRVINLFFKKEIGKVNKNIFGNNLLGYVPDPPETSDEKNYNCSDYGSGIWDSKLKSPPKEVIDLAKKSGMSIARFPGGCGTHHYDWKNSIGKNRKHFLYGLDEFLKTCKEIGAESVITVSYFTGDEFDAADLVEYLNTPDDGKHKWAQERTKNGHLEPYRVRYFEIGNEDWHGDDRIIKEVFPQDYAARYLKYYKKMKLIDSSIKIGAILKDDEWNRKVLELIKKNIDFGIIHIYPHPDASGEEIKNMDPKSIFKETLGAALLKEETNLLKTLRILKEKSGRDIPLAITEYNGGFWDNDPLPYRHCLGTALLNAELLRIFMKPEYKILMANYWQFCNNYWGMVTNGSDKFPAELYHPYYKRPNFYVFQLYREHFGDKLIDIKVDCFHHKSEGHRIPDLSINASKSSDERKIYLMVVNKNMNDNIPVKITLDDINFNGRVNVYVLNGPSVSATNEQNHNNIKVRHKTFKINGASFKFIFEPHSLTAIEIERSGSIDVQK